MKIHQVVNLTGPEHSFKVVPNHKTSIRGIALIICAAIGFLYSLSL